MISYEEIKKLAKEQERSCRDFIVLAPQNDPFYAGSKTNKKMAEWFAELWQRFGYTQGIHLRRIHYRLVSEEECKKHNGEAYFNTVNDWSYLLAASKQARYLGLVSADSFVDRRNPNAHIFTEINMFSDWPPWPSWEWDLDGWHIPYNDIFQMGLPNGSVSGYDYSQADQEFHIELWAEKSTMDDILLPLGRKYGVNVVTSLGFQSITNVIEMIERVSRISKPTRIFYISDFDPAGDPMPTAVARQIEYWIQEINESLEIKLQPLILTKEQQERYRLPRTPIKPTDMRKANFEKKYGSGAVELDALEALKPGEFRRIVEEAILPYRDMNLREELSAAEDEAQDIVDEAIDEISKIYSDKIEILEAETREILEKQSEEIQPYREKIESLKAVISNHLEGLNSLGLPGRPEASTDTPDEDNWLFDTERSYGQQLDYYKERQAGK